MGGNLIYTFKRPGTSKPYTVTVEHGTDLQTWPGQIAIPIVATTGPPVGVVDNGTSPDDITVTIPMGTEPKRFARIKGDTPFTP